MAADPARRTATVDELAGVAIYTLLLADCHGIDLGEAVVAKLGKSELMYPVECTRGNTRKYSAQPWRRRHDGHRPRGSLGVAPKVPQTVP